MALNQLAKIWLVTINLSEQGLFHRLGLFIDRRL